MLTTAPPPMTYGGASEPRPQGPFGQGKRATTILADQGDHVTCITDVPYQTRSRPLPPVKSCKGTRHMHRTTLKIPNSETSNYDTTYKVHLTSRRNLHAWEMAQPGPSQHITQFSFHHHGEAQPLPWDTNYNRDYMNKGAQPPSKLHEPSLVNKEQMMTGRGMHDVLATRDPQPDYWSQYNCIHNKLGAMLGHGVSREPAVRRQYDVLTGQDKGPAWQENNKRISGNRMLYHTAGRREESRRFMLG